MSQDIKDYVTKVKGFLETPKGKKILIIIIAALIVFVVASALLFLVILSEALREPRRVVQPPRSTPKREEKEEKMIATAPPSSVDRVESFEVYESKDPFKPLITKVTTPTVTGTTETTPKVLALEDIYTEDGTKYASIKYGSTIYKVKEGDRINDSPYQVLSIGADSVTLLYGDDKIVLKLGEEIYK
ncbi:MAG: hypothetical protein AB1466_01005 [Actinomycetota bacterium]